MRFCEGVSTSMLSSSPKVGRYVEGDAILHVLGRGVKCVEELWPLVFMVVR